MGTQAASKKTTLVASQRAFLKDLEGLNGAPFSRLPVGGKSSYFAFFKPEKRPKVSILHIDLPFRMALGAHLMGYLFATVGVY